MATCSPKPIYGVLGNRNPEAYRLDLPQVKSPTYLIGPYLIGSGGCDNIHSYEVVTSLIEKYAAKGHVVFEGVLISSTYGQIGELMERWKKDSVFVFLDTPLDVCIERIEARRDGKPRDERLLKNVGGKWNSVHRVRERVEQDGIMQSVITSSDDGHETIINLLQGAGHG